MKRALASLAGIIGLAALGRWLSRRRQPAEPLADATVEPIAAQPADDPAEELRRKLADAREAEPEQTAAEPESLDERRARVHAKAREAIDAMSDDEAPS